MTAETEVQTDHARRYLTETCRRFDAKSKSCSPGTWSDTETPSGSS